MCEEQIVSRNLNSSEIRMCKQVRQPEIEK